jgi:hypothetical protein
MQWGWRRHYPAPTRFVLERVPAIEYLDRPDLPEDHRAASYRDLEFLGSLPWQFEPIWQACLELLREGRRTATAAGADDRPGELLELGAGTGFLGRKMASRARAAGIGLSIRLTDRRAAPGVGRLDWLTDPLPECDVACANLVLHHFDGGDAVSALRRMAGSARLGGVVYDLNRHPLAFGILRWAMPLVAVSPLTVADALISVQQAFTPGELEALALEAGIRNPRVTTHALFRNRLTWRT